MQDYSKDLVQIQAEVDKLSTGIITTINSDDELQLASEQLGVIASQRKHIEAKRKEFVQPLNDHVKKINNEFKMRSEPLEDLEKKIKSGIGVYHSKKEEEARKLYESEKKENAFAVVEAPKSTIRSSTATVSVKKVWKHKVVDPNKVPKSFWVIDETLIRKAIAEGARDIPGVEIFQENQISSR